MMRPVLVRLLALAAGVVIVASCDSRLPTALTPIGSTGGGSSSTNSSTNKPTVTIDTPTTGSLVNIGDSILVVMRLHDNKGLQSLSVAGYRVTGSADLGTLSSTIRYAAVNVPPAGGFRSGLRDTTIRRYLKPVSAGDTTLDSLVIRAVVTDSAGAADTVSRRVDLVSGPRVLIVAPAQGDSTPAGIGLSVTVDAQHPDGISSVSVRAVGEANWPTKLDTTISQSVSNAPRDIAVPPFIIRVPANAPVRGKVTVTATAVSTNGQPGSGGPVTVFVRSASAAQPLVTQTVGARSEIGDSITVVAHGDGITSLGYVARDGTGATIARDSVVLSQPYAGNATAQISLAKLPTTAQGQKVGITAFAVDQAGRTGYAVRAGQLSPQGNLALGTTDSTLVVYGHTYPLPQSRNSGLVGDIAWDAPREQVVLSNQAFNRLEFFHSATKTFDQTGVAVGSFPWGLFVSNDPNYLWVANSGGTNISKVDLTARKEVEGARIRTRITPIYTLTENVDTTKRDSSGAPVVHRSISDPVLYSDRPQYIGQTKDGTLYYSTRPTADAAQGTLRYLDPTQAYPDAKPIIIFSRASNSITSHVIINADSIFVISGTPNSDILVIWDHRPGTNDPGDFIATTADLNSAVAQLQAKVPGSDVTVVDGVDITGAGLTDTTYVGVSGDRNWIAFGSGNTAGSGKLFVAGPGFFSPPITQVDLVNNASEKINGIALDSTGLDIAAHGNQSFFASIDVPFHLRLQGKYPNAAPGQGIAFHPRANGSAGDVQRTAYIASNNQTVEIIDSFHYLNRGTLPIKTNLYGPLRAVLPGASDPPDVVLKLLGVSTSGLVVIDLRARDILELP